MSKSKRVHATSLSAGERRVPDKKNFLNSQKGFTLIELIVVIAIMAVLAAVTVPTVTSHLGKSREQSFTAEEERIRSAVNAFFSAPENERFIGLRQYPLLGNGQTDETTFTILSSSTDVTDEGNPFALGEDVDGDEINDTAIWNPLGGTQGADMTALWSDVNVDGVRTVSSGSADTWTTVDVTRGGVSYTTDARYYFIDFEALIAGGHLQSIPQSAGPDHTPSGSTETYDGSYIWYVDETEEIRALFSSLPSSEGFFPGVFP